MDASDVALARQAAHGADDAFRELVLRYQARVRGLIRRIVRDPSRADELAQDTFVKAHRALDHYDGTRPFASWLLTIAHHCAVDDLRRQRPQTEPLVTLGPLLPAPPPGPLGPGLVPVPDAPDLGPSGARAALRDGVGGIACQVNARVVFHHHAHLTLFVDGKQRRIPAGIGIWPPLEPQSTAPGQFSVTRGECFSWLVTRYADGLIHIEAPAARRFLLGEFFDIWNQALGRDRLGPAHGPVTAIVDGRVWTGDPREIPLQERSQIQLQVGTPLVAPQLIAFPAGY